MSKRYTNAQKAAYYARLAEADRPKRRAAPARKPTPKRAPRRAAKKESDWGAASEGLGATIGGVFGGPPGAHLGGLLGRGAHSMFKAITGFGDYQIAENSLMLGGMSPPEVVNSVNTGGVILRHREMIADINASTAFENHRYSINPGNPTTFPWLSQVAPSFEEYRFRGLIFEFKSLSSDAVLSSATSSALGAIVMATQYDVLDQEFLNKIDMENYMFANSAKPSCTFYHPVECKKSLDFAGGHLYVRPGPVPTGADPRLYDLGTFNIAAVGMQAASGVAGELWCTYEVELFKNKLDPNDTGLTDKYRLMGTIAAATPLGTTEPLPDVLVVNNLGGTVDIVNGQYLFPPGIPEGRLFLVTYFVATSGAAVAVTTPTFSLSDLTIQSDFGGTAFSVCSGPDNGVATKQLLVQFVVRTNAVTASGASAASILWSGGVLPNGSAAADLIVTQLNSEVFG